MSRNISLNGKQGNRHQKNSQKYLCSKHYKKSLNNTLNTNGGTDGQTLGRLKRIIIVALKTCKSKFVSPILEYAVPVWKSIPKFLASFKKGYAYHLSYVQLQWGFICTFSHDVKWETRVHLFQVYIASLQNENHPLYTLFFLNWTKFSMIIIWSQEQATA